MTLPPAIFSNLPERERPNSPRWIHQLVASPKGLLAAVEENGDQKCSRIFLLDGRPIPQKLLAATELKAVDAK